MKFTVSSTALLSHLQAASRVINSKNAMPILDNFLFSLESDRLVITASDNETTMVTGVSVSEAVGSGLFAIPSKILLEPLKELPDQPLTFEINDQNFEVVVNYQNGKFACPAVSGEEYPQKSPMSETASTITISAQSLLTGINRTIFAVADDELRMVMNGIFIDIHEDEIVFVASDRHKLVRYKNQSIKSGIEASFILPKKPATLLKNILGKESGNVSMSFDEKNGQFKFGNYVLTCRLIEGRYPNYASVIPQNNVNKLIVDRIAFANVIKRVSIFANQASGLVKLVLSENQVLVSSQDIDFLTSSEEKISCNYNGQSITIGFKSSFLVEILQNMQSEEALIELSDHTRAGLILPLKNEENEDLLLLLMPMML